MRIEGNFTTRSPLSHIGKSISTGSVLNTREIMQENGRLANVFCYNGNAWRGQLRRLIAVHLCKVIGLIEATGDVAFIEFDKVVETVPTDQYVFLMTGGKIGGASKFDKAQVDFTREKMPHFGLYGGCLNNQMLAGKFAMMDCLPVCKEAITELPPHLHELAGKISHKNMIIDREFSRMDSCKDVRFNGLIDADEYAKIMAKQKDDGDSSTQMRMSSQLLNSGVRLFSRILLQNCDKLELGALCAGLSMFAKYPFIGGQHNKGHGKVDLIYSVGGEHFFSITDFDVETSALFDECLSAYNAHLAENKADIMEILK